MLILENTLKILLKKIKMRKTKIDIPNDIIRICMKNYGSKAKAWLYLFNYSFFLINKKILFITQKATDTYKITQKTPTMVPREQP